jgi:bidirectional [NiFe] hydrogenase diaphorase subunit
MAAPIELVEIAARELQQRGRFPVRVKVCCSTSCLSAGAGATLEAINDGLELSGSSADVQVVPTGCLGPCSLGPLVRVERRTGEATLYGTVHPEDVVKIFPGQVVGGAPASPEPELRAKVIDESIPFFARQKRVVLANAGKIDPDRIEDYIAEGGYFTLAKVLMSKSPTEVVEVVKASGIRGRGGAGYPAGAKWELLAAAPASASPGGRKFVIANGDEGDPGAYMDRTVMEDDPHRVLEGLAIAAYATGADRAYIYVRAEYPRAVQRLDRAIRSARRHRLIGKRILGCDFDLDIEVRIGAGAFVCGEETALISSIEGRRGTPGLRPPYPTERGLFGRPSMIQNVETLANIPYIVSKGAKRFRSLGTSASPGTKVFALAGDIAITGLIEVPMGITLREIVEDIGGGVPKGHAFKAAQTGGPSGGCIPARHLDTPVDYESLRDLGSIMGSGGMIIMDETASMPQVAKFFMEFCRDESCGKCVPCRVGTVQMARILDRICSGQGRPADVTLLGQLCTLVRETSLCGLGQSAPNPVSSTLHYFQEEYDALVGTTSGGGGDA